MTSLPGKILCGGIAFGRLAFYDEVSRLTLENTRGFRPNPDRKFSGSRERETVYEDCDGRPDPVRSPSGFRARERYGGGPQNPELARFAEAENEVARRLDSMYERAREAAGEDKALIFKAEKLLLTDTEFCDEVTRIINESGVSAKRAVSTACEKFSKTIREAGDDYIGARADDIRAVSELILSILDESQGSGQAEVISTEFDPAADGRRLIIAPGTLTPADVVRLDKDFVAGIVTSNVSVYSHTAIMLTAMGIPAITLSGDADIFHDRKLYDGKDALLDACDGTLYICPDEKIRDEMAVKSGEAARRRDRLTRLRGKANVTAGGLKIDICANIGSLADLSHEDLDEASGIGLLRSEFFAADQENIPDEDAQFLLYLRAVKAAKGKKTVIRTFDFGDDGKRLILEEPTRVAGDKQIRAQEETSRVIGDSRRMTDNGVPQRVSYFQVSGLRGIRLGLLMPRILRTQLRAILRASAYGDVALLLPMVTSADEVAAVRKMIAREAKNLKDSGFSCDDKIPVGAMIETPAAALTCGDILREADFISIGTNDLAQYTLAADRTDPAQEMYYDRAHPAVLALIKTAAKAARTAGKRVSVCGDLAADTEYAEMFLRLHVDALSVPPAKILSLREHIRSIS